MVLVPAYSLLKQEQLQLAQLTFVIIYKPFWMKLEMVALFPHILKKWTREQRSLLRPDRSLPRQRLRLQWTSRKHLVFGVPQGCVSSVSRVTENCCHKKCYDSYCTPCRGLQKHSGSSEQLYQAVSYTDVWNFVDVCDIISGCLVFGFHQVRSSPRPLVKLARHGKLKSVLWVFPT